ncbi:ketosynthase [Streptomyces nogalater]|uniref:Ketosynthase n=1 Tax=Streptomyces nogalater TaxID=38314 RepID=A0ABW0WDN3_STRNO
MTSHSPTAPVRAWAGPDAPTVVRAGVSTSGPQGEVPPLPGFVRSPFAPLVHDAVRRCVGPPDSADSPVAGRGARTAIVLGSMACDAVTADIAGEKVARGGVAEPVLFHQTVTTAVLGVIARDYRITGPVTCVSSMTDPGAALLGSAELLLAAAEADQVLAILVELAPGPRTSAALTAAAEERVTAPVPDRDTAVAVLLRPSEGGPGSPLTDSPPPPATATARLLAYAAPTACRGVR